jgi:hypothetical protein
MDDQVIPTGIPATTPAQGELPAELRGWNWGAFLMNWIWGIGNNTYLALLCFVPFLSFIMPFVLGIKGNEWAWKNREFASIEEFKAVQKAWTRVGVIVFTLGIFISIACVSLMVSVLGSLDSSATKAKDAMRQSDITMIGKAAELYANDHNGSYATSLSQLDISYDTDPEGTPYVYTSNGKSYEVCATLSTAEDYCESSN